MRPPFKRVTRNHRTNMLLAEERVLHKTHHINISCWASDIGYSYSDIVNRWLAQRDGSNRINDCKDDFKFVEIH